MNRNALLLIGIAALAAWVVSTGYSQVTATSKNGRTKSVTIRGKEYNLERSIPVIRDLLNSSEAAAREDALIATDYWAEELKGSDLVPEWMRRYEAATEADARREILTLLCRIADPRTEPLFQQAAASNDEVIKIIGLVGMADQRGAVVVPQCARVFIEATNAAVVHQAEITLDRLTELEWPHPPADVRTSASAKQSYLRQFDLWWEKSMNRFVTNNPLNRVTHQTQSVVKISGGMAEASVVGSNMPASLRDGVRTQVVAQTAEAASPVNKPRNTFNGVMIAAIVAAIGLPCLLWWHARKK